MLRSSSQSPRDSYLPAAAASEGRQARAAAEKQSLEIEKLRLVVEAMWRIMQDEHGYTDQQLMAKIAQIDMVDGKLDGRKKVANFPHDCPRCHRKTSRGTPRCMYCGEVFLIDPFG